MGKQNNEAWSNTKYIMAYLRQKGIPKPMLERIRVALCEDAVMDADNIRYNRIYTGIAIMLHRHCGFGRKRTLGALHYFDDLVGKIKDDKISWPDLMQQLDDELHIVIRCGDDEKDLYEYRSAYEKEE